jgi:hypothetical protein
MCGAVPARMNRLTVGRQERLGVPCKTRVYRSLRNLGAVDRLKQQHDEADR